MPAIIGRPSVSFSSTVSHAAPPRATPVAPPLDSFSAGDAKKGPSLVTPLPPERPQSVGMHDDLRPTVDAREALTPKPEPLSDDGPAASAPSGRRPSVPGSIPPPKRPSLGEIISEHGEAIDTMLNPLKGLTQFEDRVTMWQVAGYSEKDARTLAKEDLKAEVMAGPHAVTFLQRQVELLEQGVPAQLAEDRALREVYDGINARTAEVGREVSTSPSAVPFHPEYETVDPG